MAAGESVDPAHWQVRFDELLGRIAGRFARVEPRRRVRAFVAGLLAELPRKNCWTLAEHAGEASPDGMQHLLARAVWDADAVRDDVRGYLMEHLADPDAVPVVDETGDRKKGSATVGVQRQYTGTTGRTENAQVTVWLIYATTAGHGLIDRALCLPRRWADDPDRRAGASVPAGVSFATKPTLARQMIARTLAAGVPAGWVSADEVYGADPQLRDELERRGLGYVLAVARDHRVPTVAGPTRADMLTLQLPARAWQPLWAGAGAKGDRVYDWAPIDIPSKAAGHRWLLVRRHRRTGKRAYYRCYSPAPAPLTTLVHVAGSRWTWRRTSRPAKDSPAWTSTRSVPGPPGTAGPPSPCSPTPSSPSPPQSNTPEHPHQPTRSRSPVTRSATSSPRSYSLPCGAWTGDCTGRPGDDARQVGM